MYRGERSGDTCYSIAMMDFSNFIFEQGLTDIPLVGEKFMWSNESENQFFIFL